MAITPKDPNPYRAEYSGQRGFSTEAFLLILAYTLVLVVAIRVSLKIALSRANDLWLWGAVVFGFNIGALALTFSYPFYMSQGGMELWLLNGAVFQALKPSSAGSAMASYKWEMLTGEYPPQPGGVSDHTRRVAAALAAAGDTVNVGRLETAPDRKWMVQYIFTGCLAALDPAHCWFSIVL